MNRTLNSNLRKKTISGWLKQNYAQGFSSDLKLQKFLFFYESLSKVDGDESDFSYLKGYENGPVFSNVYGDYCYRNTRFIEEVEEAYELNHKLVDEQRANLSGFLVNILNEEDLSDLTHELNIWKVKEEEIKGGAKHMPLEEKDFNINDVNILNSLREMYTTDYIESVEIIEMSDKSFVIEKEDFTNLTEDHEDVLITLASNEGLDNPVYLTLSEDGVLLV